MKISELKGKSKHDLVSFTINRKETKPIEPVEQRNNAFAGLDDAKLMRLLKEPSQEPADDGEKLGPCSDVVCQDAIIESTACDHCELNPMTLEYEEENGLDDCGN
jgi:hypothetical protein